MGGRTIILVGGFLLCHNKRAGAGNDDDRTTERRTSDRAEVGVGWWYLATYIFLSHIIDFTVACLSHWVEYHCNSRYWRSRKIFGPGTKSRGRDLALLKPMHFCLDLPKYLVVPEN